MIVFIMRHNTIQFNTCSVNIYHTFAFFLKDSNALLLITQIILFEKGLKR